MGKRKEITEKQVSSLAFQNRELGFRHHTYDEDMEKYELLRQGNPLGIEQLRVSFDPEENLEGALSENPLKNAKYLFIAATTLACRFAIEGGMDSETAYNASDLYIRRMDSFHQVDAVVEMAVEMFTFYTDHMARLKEKAVYSLPVIRCQDYIDLKLHAKITVPELAEVVHLNPSYLSRLFKRETGVSITDYIIRRKIIAAQNMLKYSDFSIAAISNYLEFSSQSYFDKVFRKATGQTPNEYRKHNFRTSFGSAD